jgi:hypothetical protein
MMKNRNQCIVVVVAVALAGLIVGVARAQAPIWNTGPFGGLFGTTIEQQVATLNDIQPGLGTVMIEYSNRYTNMFYAAKGGNWDLAAYMLKEQLEIQEVGETTRPARASALKAFEETYLNPISDAIAAKDFTAFQTAFTAGISGCNGCHAAQGFRFIQYVLPAAPPMPLSTAPPPPLAPAP